MTSTDDFSGPGIWRQCDCGRAHEIDQSPEFRELVEDQCRAISASTQSLYEEFRITAPGGRWDVVPDEARFVFTNAEGLRAIAQYGVAGSYNFETCSWMWGWNMPEDWMPAPATEAACRLYDIGEAEGWEVLTEPLLKLDEHEAWHMTNLVAWASGFPLTYRAKVNDINWHFFAIARPVWEA